MKIVVKNNELNFSKVPEIFINGENRKSDDWSSTILFNNYELDFQFDESLFKNKETGEINIDWIIIEELVEHIFENVENIQIKGANILEPLFKEIFGQKHLNESKGYFEIGGIELKEFRKKEKNPYSKSFLEYEIYYFLDSKKDYLIDPYYSYTVNFSNHNGLTLIGASRNG